MAWRRRREPIAMQPPIACQNGQSVWLYKWPLCHRISDFLSSATKTTSSLTLRWYRDPTLKSLSSWIWTSCSNQLAHSVIPCRYPVRSKKALREEQISAQRCCKCMPESPARWWHSRWVCVTLGEIPRWRCTQRGWMLRLRVFQSCLSALADSFLFRERLTPSCFLPLRDLWEKNSEQRIWAGGDKWAHVGSMPTKHDQSPSAVSDMISLGASDAN